MSDSRYDDLATRAERGELTIKPGTVLRGEPARSAARDALMEATGAGTVPQAATLAVGRPRAGTGRGPSPVVRARVPQELKDRVQAIAAHEHRDESDIVREAVAAYVALRQVS
jgi:hypothetical protein